MKYPASLFLERPRARSALLVVAIFASCILVSQLRFIDGDEGYLLMAAKLVSEGKLPYRDFFFPQGPILPYVYAALLSPFGITWQSGRLLSALFAAGTGWLALVAIERRGGDFRAKALGAFLFTTTTLAFVWLPIAKTYSLAAFFSMAAYVATLPSIGEKRATWRAIWFGLSAAMAVGVRLYCVALVLLLFWKSLRKNRGRDLALASGAFALGLLPSLWICTFDPYNAFYGLLGYHLNRSELGLGASLSQKVLVLRELVGFGPSGHAAGLQLFALLLVLVTAGRRGTLHFRRDGALWMAAGLAIVSVLPTPTYSQYFALCTPFVIPVVALSAFRGWPKLSTRTTRFALAAALSAYAALGAFEWFRYGFSGKNVIGVDRPSAWTLSASTQMARLLDAHAPCGPVLASWPGYLLESKAVPFERTENHFSTHAGQAIASADERRRRRVFSVSDLHSLIESEAAATIVLGNWTRETFQGDPTTFLEAADYRPVATVAGATVWVSSGSDCGDRDREEERLLVDIVNAAPAGALPAEGEGAEDAEPRARQRRADHP